MSNSLSATLALACVLLLPACERTTPPPAPAPGLRCQGNEPFWNLVVDDTSGRFEALGDDAGPRPLTASWNRDAEGTPAGLTWTGRQGDSDFVVQARIVAERCLDTMSDETPPFSHRITLQTPTLGEVEGCCRELP